ncbi:MAG: hypothetical protein NZ805_03375 [Armatimonadetes bacterium]|nr:hypothetical protein [Armatimonadota bacterium]MDW8027332.1 hypothetical protein [Armatimonadota bacterium]
MPQVRTCDPNEPPANFCMSENFCTVGADFTAGANHPLCEQKPPTNWKPSLFATRLVGALLATPQIR